MNLASTSDREPVNLYAQAFIDGFSKPSYVVLCAEFDNALPASVFRGAVEHLAQTQPLVRSKVVRNALGFASHFEHHSMAKWREHCPVTVLDNYDMDQLRSFQEQLLSEALDPTLDYPLQAWLLTDSTSRRSCVLVKVHHAIVDAHSGRHLVLGFVTACHALLNDNPLPDISPKPSSHAAEKSLKQRYQALRQWLRGIAPPTRIPEVSLLCDYRVDRPLDQLPVTVAQRTRPLQWYYDTRQAADACGTTFSQHLCAALLRTMRHYNAAAYPTQPAPGELGLMVATSRRFRRKLREKPRGFVADTRLLCVPDRALTDTHDGQLRAIVADGLAVRRDSHNDVALGLLVASAWLRRHSVRWLPGVRPNAAAASRRVRSLHFTLSDLSVGATRIRPITLSDDLHVTGLQYLVSPVAAEHAGLVTHIYGDKFYFTLLAHADAVDDTAFFNALFAELSPTDTTEP